MRGVVRSAAARVARALVIAMVIMCILILLMKYAMMFVLYSYRYNLGV